MSAYGTNPNRSLVRATTPTDTDIKADIGRALFGMIDALSDVQTGVNAFLQVAADSKSEFAQTAHWMIQKVDADLGHATELADAARGALRVGDRTPYKQWVEEAQAAAERLEAFVAAAPAEPECVGDREYRPWRPQRCRLHARLCSALGRAGAYRRGPASGRHRCPGRCGMSATEVTSPKRWRQTKYIGGNLRSTGRYRRRVKGFTRIVHSPVSTDRKERAFLRAAVDVIFDKWEIE